MHPRAFDIFGLVKARTLCIKDRESIFLVLAYSPLQPEPLNDASTTGTFVQKCLLRRSPPQPKNQPLKKTENQTTKETQGTKKAGKRVRSPEAESEAEEPHPQKRSKKADNAAAEKEVVPVANSSEAATNASSPVSLSGKFDLYAMQLPFLAKVYLPQGESEPQFIALHKKILEYQAKPDFTAMLAPRSQGFIEGWAASEREHPMEGMPWDIAIWDLELTS
ncbi:hypothetical protein C8R45DRAFT_60969 [Mycena sanguinolenta]|nr:hypothetical protein C8R45DRAFT_60969 [Mycena sanguinolenta]